MTLEKVYLGTTGIRVSELALGTAGFGNVGEFGGDMTMADAHDLLDAYAAAGGNFIDTADRYGNGMSEQWIGDWLEDRDRDDFVIASKIGRPTLDRNDLSRKHLRAQLEASLDRLGTDYLDLLYFHRWDADTSAESVMRTFSGFVDAGRVHHIGASAREPNAWRVSKANELAQRRGYEPFTVAQPRYNLVQREIEDNYLEMIRDYDLALAPYNPLCEGFLTGKYRRDEAVPEDSRAARRSAVTERYFTAANFDLLDLVREIADELDVTPVQVSLAWLVQHPDVTTPIIGARTVEQLEENIAATSLTLPTDRMDQLSTFFD